LKDLNSHIKTRLAELKEEEGAFENEQPDDYAFRSCILARIRRQRKRKQVRELEHSCLDRSCAVPDVAVIMDIGGGIRNLEINILIKINYVRVYLYLSPGYDVL